jgi:photosystem II stability/assembly factor-like uncharacterized protein
MITRRTVLALAAVTAPAMAAPRWQVRFFHDEDDSSIALRQIEFLSAQRGIAVGLHTNRSNRTEGVALITSDGGKTWNTLQLPDRPVSLFCLDESACWLVGANGIYFSAEGGRDWKRISRERLITRVVFTTRERGFAVGARSKLLETADGGRTWKKMPVAETVKTSQERTVFHVATFLTPKMGVIAGRAEPLRLIDVPIWMDPDPQDSVEFPTLSSIIQTRDGGETWEAGTTSLFGRISQVKGRLAAGFALALVEYDRHFRHPAELMRIDLKTGGTETVIARKDFAITDVAVKPDGTVYAAGFQPAGALARTPVPGKVRVMSSSGDLKLWRDMEVDYRAVATRVSITAAADGSLWMATDEGMVLLLAH